MKLPDPCPICAKNHPESIYTCIHCGAHMIQFIGGPLDGENPVHPAMNYTLYCDSNKEGHYLFSLDKYYWVTGE